MELEVILAQDLPVGPKGGTRKADETVSLPAVEAQELVYLGKARWPEGKAPQRPSTEVDDAPAPRSSGGTKAKAKPRTTAPREDNGTGEVPDEMKDGE